MEITMLDASETKLSDDLTTLRSREARAGHVIGDTLVGIVSVILAAYLLTSWIDERERERDAPENPEMVMPVAE